MAISDYRDQIRLLKWNEDHEDWLPEEEARARVNAGTYIEVYRTRVTRRFGVQVEFFGIKPAPPVYKGKEYRPVPILTTGEIEINAGLYPGMLHKGQTHEDKPVHRNLYERVRAKVRALRGIRHSRSLAHEIGAS